MYITIKPFRCRYQNKKLFKIDDDYKSVNKEHTEKLIKKGYIKEKVQKKNAKKQSVSKEKNDKK